MQSGSKLLWVVISTSLFAIVGIVGFIADIKTLSDKLHWLPLFTAVLALAGIAITITLWIHYEKERRKILASVKSGSTSGCLGLPREELDLQNKVLETMRKPGIREIDLGGLALRTPYFRKDSAFSRRLLELLKTNNNLAVRVWLLDPKSTGLKLRETAEAVVGNRLGATCTESLETLNSIVQTIWKEQKKRRPTVVLVDKVAVMHSIFRVDNEMWVTLYLQHGTGGRSPIVHLTSEDDWFESYKEQFDKCFDMHKGNKYPTQEELEDTGRNMGANSGA